MMTLRFVCAKATGERNAASRRKTTHSRPAIRKRIFLVNNLPPPTFFRNCAFQRTLSPLFLELRILKEFWTHFLELHIVKDLAEKWDRGQTRAENSGAEAGREERNGARHEGNEIHGLGGAGLQTS